MYDFIKKLGGSRPSTPVYPSTPAPFSSAKSKLMGWSSRATSPVIAFPAKGKIITPPATPGTPVAPKFRPRDLPDVGKTPVASTPKPTPMYKKERRSSDAERYSSDTEILKPRPLRVMRRPSILGQPVIPVEEVAPPPKSAPSVPPPIRIQTQNQHRARARSSPAPPPPPPPVPQTQRLLIAHAAPPPIPGHYYDRARSTDPTTTPASRDRRGRDRSKDRSRDHRRAASYSATAGNNVSPRLAQVNLHWSMLPRGYSSKSIWFDIRFETYNIRLYEQSQRPRPLKPDERSKLAVDGSITVMYLLLTGFHQWPVTVKNRGGITCLDVWDAIFETFNERISPADWHRGYVSRQAVDYCHPAFEQRCRDSERTKLEGYEARQGMRRVDLLNGRTIFGGLIKADSGRLLAPGECELELVLLQPHPAPFYQ